MSVYKGRYLYKQILIRILPLDLNVDWIRFTQVRELRIK
jgi:hypothetical protein